MILDKTVWPKLYGQNSTDKMVALFGTENGIGTHRVGIHRRVVW